MKTKYFDFEIFNETSKNGIVIGKKIIATENEPLNTEKGYLIENGKDVHYKYIIVERSYLKELKDGKGDILLNVGQHTVRLSSEEHKALFLELQNEIIRFANEKAEKEQSAEKRVYKNLIEE